MIIPLSNTEQGSPKYIVKSNSILKTGNLNTNLDDVNLDPKQLNEAIVHWDSVKEMTDDGELFALRFKVNDNAPSGKQIIELSYEKKDMIGVNGCIVIPFVNSGEIIMVESSEEISYEKGDVNLDTEISSMDSILLAKYLAGWDRERIGWDNRLEKREEAADIFTDGLINTKDAVSLSMKLVNRDYTHASSALAADNEVESIKVCVSDEVGVPGGYIDVPVTIENNPGIAGFKFNLSYDNNYLTPVKFSEGDIPGLEAMDESDNSNPRLGIISNLDDAALDKNTLDHITAQWCDDDNVTVGGTLFTVRFKISETAQVGQLLPINIACDANNPMCGVSEDGIIYDINSVMNGGIVTVSSENEPEMYSYIINKVSIIDNGDDVQAPPENGDFDVEVKIDNLLEKFTPGEIIAAAYDENGSLICETSKPIDENLINGEICRFYINKTERIISKVKIYIWSSFDEMKPLAKDYTI